MEYCFLCLQSVSGDYTLRVQVHGYSNPTNDCSTCGGCCDSRFSAACFGVNSCDNEFLFCLRSFDSAPLSTQAVKDSIREPNATIRGSTLECLASPPARRSSIDWNDMFGQFGNFSSSMFLGLPNPMEFSVIATKWKARWLTSYRGETTIPNHCHTLCRASHYMWMCWTEILVKIWKGIMINWWIFSQSAYLLMKLLQAVPT